MHEQFQALDAQLNSISATTILSRTQLSNIWLYVKSLERDLEEISQQNATNLNQVKNLEGNIRHYIKKYREIMIEVIQLRQQLKVLYPAKLPSVKEEDEIAKAVDGEHIHSED